MKILKSGLLLVGKNANTDKWISEQPFEKLYTGEEYVRISCDGKYAYPEFIEMWQGFIKNFGIEEISDGQQIENDLVA